jgi:hypothetical protein
MNYSIDQSSDYSHKELYQYLSGVNLPQYVKEASLDDVSRQMTKTACADKQYDLFPVHTKAAAYVSNAFFVNKVDSLRELRGDNYINKVAYALGDAAILWGIQDDIKAYNKVALSRLEGEYEDRSVTFKIAEDDLELFSIKTASDVTREANNFVSNINKYPFEWRRNIASKFVKVAEALGLDELPDLVLKYAGQYYPDAVGVKAELARRMTKLSADNKTRYQSLISDVENISSKEEFFKLAECLHYIEKNAGLYDKPQYRKVLGDVVDKVFTLHFDKVAELCDVVEMGGEKFASADLDKVAEDIFEQAFGFKISTKEAEFKDIAPTLPRSDVELFKLLSGVKPI